MRDGTPLREEPWEVVTVQAQDGRVLLRVMSDGEWTVSPEDAPEAARIFASIVAGELLRLIPGRVYGV